MRHMLSLKISQSPGILEPPQLSITAPGSLMSLSESVIESADGQSYYSLYPLRPGVTTFEVREILPYKDRKYTYKGKFYHNVDSFIIGVTPQDMVLSGNGLLKKETDVEENFAVYESPPVEAGTELVWTFSGGTPIPELEHSEATDNSTVLTIPSDIERYALIIGPLLLMGFILVLWYAHNRSQDRAKPADDLSERQLKERREQLLTSLAELDHRHETHSIKQEEYAKQRSKSKRELVRIFQLLKKSKMK